MKKISNDNLTKIGMFILVTMLLIINICIFLEVIFNKSVFIKIMVYYSFIVTIVFLILGVYNIIAKHITFGTFNFFKKKIRFFKRRFILRLKNDPVYACKVYRKEGCSHVDGILCDYPNCSILKEYLDNKRYKNRNNNITIINIVG